MEFEKNTLLFVPIRRRELSLLNWAKPEQ